MNPLLAVVGNPPRYATNPLLAIVGNPYERTPAQLRRQHMDPGYFDENPAHFPCVARAEREWEEAVAGVVVSGRVKRKKSKAKKKVRKNRPVIGKKKPSPKKRKYSIEEARKKFKGVDGAVKAFKRFHGRNPDHVEVYEFDDGSSETTTDRAHAALHRTIETNYMVPWDSNKQGTLWKHEHVEGWGLEGQSGPEPDPEEFPLEIYDPATKTTRKLGGKFSIRDWWYE